MFFYTSLFLLISTHISSGQYDVNNVFSGTRMSVNDELFVSASNAFSNFAVIMHPFRNTTAGGPIRCNFRYNTTDRFVHSVAVVGITNNTSNTTKFTFVFAAEQMSTMTPYVCVASIIESTCATQVQCTNLNPPNSHQEYFLIGVDNNRTFAFGFASSFAFKLHILSNTIMLNLTIDSIWPSSGFVPHAMDVSDSWAVVAGYGYNDEVKKNYAAVACLVDLTVMINASCTVLISETTYLVPSNVIYYSDLYELSVSIRGNQVLAGIQRLSSIVLLTKVGSSLNVTNQYQLSYADASSIGRVVDWADDTSIAVLVLNPSETPWSKSQIYVFNVQSITLTTPVFTFPNNQQILGSRLSSPSFARFGITSSGNMAILTDHADILIIPVARAGYTSIWVDTTQRVFVFYYLPQLCIGGTYKNQSSLGPCQICPPRTRNAGTSVDPVLRCVPCSNASSNSYCPLAALADVDISTVSSYSQALAYPETSSTTDMEELLMKNVFQLSSVHRCLMISPLLWTLVVSGFCIFVLVLMMLIKICGPEQCVKCRKKAKDIFKHTDIIGEGEMWIGGLATLAIIVLISFAYWFAVSFIRRYPIEEVSDPATFACDQTMVNAQFSSGLNLLDIPKPEGAQRIFDLLDAQTFYLTVQLINTGFPCNAITTQEDLYGTKYVPITTNCTRSVNDAITSVTFAVPRHKTTVQLNVTGPYWIGALRLCFRSSGVMNGSSALRDLDFCQLYSTINEAIGRSINIPIVFIKAINMTQAMSSSEDVTYSGLWLPTFTSVSLSDEAYYAEFGNYLRYTSSLSTIEIVLDERPFYIKNAQQPIVRTAELIFKVLLFTSLCIELFAFAFLIMKLFVIPIVRRIPLLLKKCCKHKATSSHESSSFYLEASSSSKEDSLSKTDREGSITPERTNVKLARNQYERQEKYSMPDIDFNEPVFMTKL